MNLVDAEITRKNGRHKSTTYLILAWMTIEGRSHIVAAESVLAGSNNNQMCGHGQARVLSNTLLFRGLGLLNESL